MNQSVNQSLSTRLSALDEDLLRIETPLRPMHWCFVTRLKTSATHRIDIDALRDRIMHRAKQRDLFQVSIDRRRFRSPRVTVDPSIPDSVRVVHTTVSGEAELRYRVGQMLMSFSDTERLWDVTLVDDTSGENQYLIVRVHHCLGDGISAAGFAFLFLDGTDEELAQLDRFLVSPRFEMFEIDKSALLRSWRHLSKSWFDGIKATRPSFGPISRTRAINFVELSASAVNQAARSHEATQMEFLLASVTLEMKKLLGSRPDGPTMVRTMIPITLDLSLRHTGNAMAFALVNLNLVVGSFEEALHDVRSQLRAISDERPNYALPRLTQSSGGPWVAKRLASIGIMSTVRPDLDVGINPLYVPTETIFGVSVDAVFPFSPLVYTPVSIAALILGDRLSIGVNSDASAVGNMGEVLATELGARLLDTRTSQRARA